MSGRTTGAGQSRWMSGAPTVINKIPVEIRALVLGRCLGTCRTSAPSDRTSQAKLPAPVRESTPEGISRHPPNRAGRRSQSAGNPFQRGLSSERQAVSSTARACSAICDVGSPAGPWALTRGSVPLPPIAAEVGAWGTLPLRATNAARSRTLAYQRVMHGYFEAIGRVSEPGLGRPSGARCCRRWQKTPSEHAGASRLSALSVVGSGLSHVGRRPAR
jgi:hypothetical protein